MKHGRYSKVRKAQLRQLIEEHAKDPDPLNMLEELAVTRAILEDQLGRRSINAKLVGELANTISRIIKRIEDIEAANAISRNEFLRLMRQLGGIVKEALLEHVTDPDQATAILRDVAGGWERLPI